MDGIFVLFGKHPPSSSTMLGCYTPSPTSLPDPIAGIVLKMASDKYSCFSQLPFSATFPIIMLDCYAQLLVLFNYINQILNLIRNKLKIVCTNSLIDPKT